MFDKLFDYEQFYLKSKLENIIFSENINQFNYACIKNNIPLTFISIRDYKSYETGNSCIELGKIHVDYWEGNIQNALEHEKFKSSSDFNTDYQMRWGSYKTENKKDIILICAKTIGIKELIIINNYKIKALYSDNYMHIIKLIPFNHLIKKFGIASNINSKLIIEAKSYFLKIVNELGYK